MPGDVAHFRPIRGLEIILHTRTHTHTYREWTYCQALLFEQRLQKHGLMLSSFWKIMPKILVKFSKNKKFILFRILHLTRCINMYVLKQFWEFFCRMIYSKNNTDILVDPLFSMYFHVFSSWSNWNGKNVDKIFETFSPILSKWISIRRFFQIIRYLKWL